MKRKDLLVSYSDNGWFNAGLTKKWLKDILGTTLFGHRLLIWDSYKCHISEETKVYLKALKIDVLVIAGGCTKFLQTLDVSANKPFKASVGKLYDEWMMTGERTFTTQGNVRAASKTELCNWVTSAWADIGEDLIKKSFAACGQVNNAKLEDVSCMKPGRPLEEALPLAKELWKLKTEEIDF